LFSYVCREVVGVDTIRTGGSPKPHYAQVAIIHEPAHRSCRALQLLGHLCDSQQFMGCAHTPSGGSGFGALRYSVQRTTLVPSSATLSTGIASNGSEAQSKWTRAQVKHMRPLG
jgi:hypothetical protein